jgi:PAS domain S-box-containing protein
LVFLSTNSNHSNFSLDSIPKEYLKMLGQTARQHLLLAIDGKANGFIVLNENPIPEPEVPNNKISLTISWKNLPEEIKEFVQTVYRTGIPDSVLVAAEPINGAFTLVEYDAVKLSETQLLVGYRDYIINRDMLPLVPGIDQDIQRLRDNVPIGLFRMSLDRRLVYVNRWFAHILGYDCESEIQGLNLNSLFENEQQEKLFTAELESDRDGHKMEIFLKRKNTTPNWYGIRIQLSKNHDNGSQFYEGYLYDISERKQEQEHRKDAEVIFNTLADNIRSAIFMFDKDGKFIFCNPALEEITGFQHDALLKMHFYELVSPDFQTLVKQRGLARVNGENGIPKSYELKIVTKSGIEKWIEIHATRLELIGNNVVLGLGYDISERKFALDEINESREKYKTLYSFFRMMVDNVPDMIWAKDLKKRYIFTNKAMCDQLLMAKNTDEPIGKTDPFFAARERKKYPENDAWHTFGELCPDSDEVVLRSKNAHQFDEFGNVKGEFLYLDVNKAPLLDDNGDMIGIVGSARDVTASKRLENQRGKEEKIKNLVYRIGNAVNTTKDIGELLSVIRIELGQIIDTSNLFIALYDKKTEELSLSYFVDEKDRFKTIPAGKSLTSYLIRKKSPMLLKESELLALVDKGEIELIGSLAKVWLGVPLLFKGEIIGALVVQNYTNKDAFGNDDLELLQFISIQISISINQKMADDALRENEFTLRQIIDNVPVMIYAKDKNLRFLLANKALADACGKRVHEIEGNLQSDIHPSPSEAARYEKDDLEVIQSGKAKVIHEDSFTDKNGELKILKSIKIPMKTGTDRGIALLGVSIDITERIRFEQELKKAKQKAEESDHLKTAFLANMSHEIRTPMNAIVGFAELLNDTDISPVTRKEFIDLIGINSSILLKLIEDIIDIAKIEANQIKIIKGACQVNRIIDDLEKNYRGQLAKTNSKEIVMRSLKAIPDAYFAIETDPLRFKQILNNLIGNAIKFTEKGFVEIGYFIEKPSAIVFYVKDSGIGLAPEKKSLIFERFRQVEESSTREYGGTGLGLTICHRLVEIWMEKCGLTQRWEWEVHFISGCHLILLKFNPKCNLFTSICINMIGQIKQSLWQKMKIQISS